MARRSPLSFLVTKNPDTHQHTLERFKRPDKLGRYIVIDKCTRPKCDYSKAVDLIKSV